MSSSHTKQAAKHPKTVSGKEDSTAVLNMLTQLQAQVAKLGAESKSGDKEELTSLRAENIKLREENAELRRQLSLAQQQHQPPYQAEGVEVASGRPVHQPYLRLADGAGTGDLGSLEGAPPEASSVSSAHPLSGGVMGEVLEPDGINQGEAVGDRLVAMHEMMRRTMQTNAYVSTTLLLAFTRQIPLDHAEDLYTLWRCMGGKEDYPLCRSRLNALTAILSECRRDHLVLTPSRDGRAVAKSALLVPEDEVTLFVGVIASRLPSLRRLTLLGYATWPVDGRGFSRVGVPFSGLTSLEVLATPWEPTNLVSTVNTLRNRGQGALEKLEVSASAGPVNFDRDHLLRHFGGLLTFH